MRSKHADRVSAVLCGGLGLLRQYFCGEKNRRLVGELLLLVLAIIYGYRYVVTKEIVTFYSVNFLSSVRFGLGMLIYPLLMGRKLKKIKINKQTIYYGVLSSLLNVAFVWCQTYGLQYTAAGKGSFLTSVYIILIPFATWLLYKTKPALRQVFAALICLGGIGLMSLNDRFSLYPADSVIILAAVFCTFSMILTDKALKKPAVDLLGFCFVSTLSAALLFIGATCIQHGWPTAYLPGSWWKLLFISVLCAGICNILFSWALKQSDSTRGAIIAATESIFATIFGVLLLNEKVTLRIGLGSVAIFGAAIMVVSQNEKQKKSVVSDERKTA